MMDEGKFFEQTEDTKKEEQILADLLTYDNPREEEYEALIKRESQTPRQEYVDFTAFWNDFFYPGSGLSEKAVEYLKEKLKGKIMIDLCGGGTMKRPHVIPEVAAGADCKAYINVDISATNFEKTRTDVAIEAFSVKSDALKFVSKMKEGNFVFTINGVDEDIITDEEYRKALAEEISRVVPSGGIVFGFNCELPLEEFGFKLISKDLGIKIRSFAATFHQIFEKI